MEKEEINELKANLLELDAQVKLLVKTEIRLRRTQTDLERSRQTIAEHNRTLEQKVEERTRELTIAKRQADEANRAKSDFLSNMSHEIRTPMNAVIGFGELLKSTPLTVQQKDYVDTMCTSGELLIALINDILEIAKIESSKIVLEEIDFDMEYLISSVLKILRSRLGGKTIDLNLVYPEGIPRHFKGDPTRLRQIFMNLVGNAIKFTDQGEVTVRVKGEDAGFAGDAGMSKTYLFRERHRHRHSEGKTERHFRSFYPSGFFSNAQIQRQRPGTHHYQVAPHNDGQQHRGSIGAGERCGVLFYPAP